MKRINIKDINETMSNTSTGQVFKCIGSEFHTYFDNVDAMVYRIWCHLRKIKDANEEHKPKD